MNDMNFDMKKALRHSCEVRYDRVQLIVLGTALLFFVILLVTILPEGQKETEKARQDIAWLEAHKNDPPYADSPFMYDMEMQMAQDRLTRREQSDGAAGGSLVLVVLLFGSFAGYFAWRLWKTLHKPDRYQLCKGRLTNPTPAFGRRWVSFKARFTTLDGTTVTRETRGIFSSAYLPLYNDMTVYDSCEVLIAYDPTEDRLAVLGRKEDLPYDASNENL